jgi:hypothetical protein
MSFLKGIGKGVWLMKECFRRLPLTLLFLLLLWAFPSSSEAQTRTKEQIETGRFGVEEQEPSETALTGETNYANHWFYLGLRTGPSLRFYTAPEDTPHTGGDAYGYSMDTAFQATWQIFSFLSLQGEMIFTWDNASVWGYFREPGASVHRAERYTENFSSFSLLFPLTARLDFYPGIFRLSPFFGAYYITPLGNLEHGNSRNGDSESLAYQVPPPFGLTLGVSWALKMGAGSIFADFRYAADLGEPEPKDGTLDTYHRNMVSVTLGYEFGFFAKKRSENHD